MGRLRKYELNGQLLSLSEVAELSGLTASTALHRLQNGKSVADILRTPLQEHTTTFVGQQYGHLTVMAFAGYTTHRKRQWECKCSCGAIIIVCQGDMRSGRTTSCGHAKKERFANDRLDEAKDWSGTRLPWGVTVVERAGFVTRADGRRGSRWRCQCACGTAFISAIQNVVRGIRKWCGHACLMRKQPPKKPYNINGVMMSMDDAALLAKMTKEALRYRMKHMGMTLEQAITTPKTTGRQGTR